MAVRSFEVIVFIAAWMLTAISIEYVPLHHHHISAAAAAAAVAAAAVIMGVQEAAAVDIAGGPLRYQIEEECHHGTVIADLTVDAGLRRRYAVDTLGLLEFRIMSPPPLPFVVDLKTGVIRTGGVIDRDSLMQCKDKDVCDVTLDVTVRPTQFFQIVKVTIRVDDVNDNAPYFRDELMTISIRESAAIFTTFSLPLASDLDSPKYGVVAYELISETTHLGLKVIDRGGRLMDARLVVQEELDRETKDEYKLQLIAYDGGQFPKSAAIDITVLILDSNDHSPVFDRTSYASNITENTPIGTIITKVKATDQDLGVNGEVMYRFSTQTQAMYGHLFTINNKTGEISVHGVIDYEQATIYQLAVIAEDLGPDSMPTDAAVVIRIHDTNDNHPSISINTLTASVSDTAEVSEDLVAGTFVAHITVLDRDSGDNGRVSCNISDPAFELVERYNTELQLLTSVVLDRETKDLYDVRITCWDEGLPPLIARRQLPVKVLDTNDHAPRFTSSAYSGKMRENNEPEEPVIYVAASDEDIGINGDFHYALLPDGVGAFDVNPDGAIVAKTLIDREQHATFTLTVLAIDHGSPSLTGSALVHILVEDLNDEAPVFSRSSYSFSVPENEPEGTAVGSVTAEDKDVALGNAVRYSFVGGHYTHECFAIEPETGEIVTTATLDREAQPVYRFTVEATDRVDATDREEKSLTGTATVTVYLSDRNDHDPSFEYPSPTNNTISISSALPLGHVVTQVIASDADLDRNSKVTYHIHAGNENGAFSIDPLRGTITLNIRLDHLDFYDYRLDLVASDGGSPPRSTHCILRVNVNSSIPFSTPPADDYPSLYSRQNLVIVVLLVCGSAVAIVTLLILIVVAWRRIYRRKKSQRYKCRMEALRALTAKELVGSAASGEITPLTTPLTTVTSSEGKSMKQRNGAVMKGENVCYKMQTMSEQMTSDAEPECLPSGQASNADSGNGHSEEEDGERSKAAALSSSSLLRPSRDFRFDLPPPPPPLITYFGPAGSTTRGVPAPSSISKPHSQASHLQSFTPSPELCRGVRRFFPETSSQVPTLPSLLPAFQTNSIRPPEFQTHPSATDRGYDGTDYNDVIV